MIYGVAINDLKYPTQKCETRIINGKRVRKVLWKCPYYSRWTAMLTRCYNKDELAKHPTYRNKFVCDEWLIFSNFKNWMEKQDWEGKHLDKDILFEGNEIYSPETCIFVSQEVNKFVIEKSKDRGLPFGVHFDANRNRPYVAQSGCNWIGDFHSAKAAELAWCEYKFDLALELAERIEDKMVAAAIVTRYSNRLEKCKGEICGDW